jgi:hypothetical protein
MGNRPLVGTLGLVWIGITLTGCGTDSCWCKPKKDPPPMLGKNPTPPTSSGTSGSYGFNSTPRNNMPDMAARSSTSGTDSMRAPSYDSASARPIGSGSSPYGSVQGSGSMQPATSSAAMGGAPTTSGWDNSRPGGTTTQTTSMGSAADPMASSGMPSSSSSMRGAENMGRGSAMPARIDDGIQSNMSTGSSSMPPPPPALPASSGSSTGSSSFAPHKQPLDVPGPGPVSTPEAPRTTTISNPMPSSPSPASSMSMPSGADATTSTALPPVAPSPMPPVSSTESTPVPVPATK